MPSGHSIHIGLNRVDPAAYAGWSGPLNACEADARSMERLCTRAGFTARTILTAAATRSGVIQAIRDEAARMVAGDTLVLSYSGHGGQMPDMNGDEEADGLDETWCLFDGQLLDDELRDLWAKFPAGARIAVFSDSCHSGSVIKAALRAGLLASETFREPGPDTDPSEMPRAMPPSIERRVYLANQTFYDGLLSRAAPRAPACSVVLVSGCQDDQLSYDGPHNGVFTGWLVWAWADGAFRGDYQALTEKIKSKIPARQTPNYMTYGAPNPTFTGGQAISI